jgi:predicted nuclease of predicted toxin-antitoxin system
MKFLLDQDVYSVTAEFPKSLGHDVLTARDIGCSQASDSELLIKAKELNRIFVTRDRDFGNLVFVKGYNSGVIYPRILPSTLKSVHKEIENVLISYSEEELKKAFVVVEHERHKFRKL